MSVKKAVSKKLVQEAWQMYQIAVLGSSKKKSQIVENGRWTNHIEPVLGEKVIGELTNFDYLILRRKLESAELSPQTVYHCLSLLRRVLNKFSEWHNNSIQIPSFKNVMPKFDNKRLRYLQNDEIRKILDKLIYLDPSMNWHDISLFAINTGLRRSELFNLCINNINLSDRYITVVDTKSCRNRNVPLNNIAIDILKKNECNESKWKNISK